MVLLLVWQPVMLIAIVGTTDEIRRNPWILIGLHLVAVLALLLGTRIPRVVPALVLGLYALAVLDLTSIPSVETPLGIAAIWMVNLTNLILPMATHKRRYVVLAVAAAITTGAAIVMFATGVIAQLGPSVSFTGLATLFAMRIGVLRIRKLVATADEAAADLAVERESILIEQSISRSSAEDARVLHDTVVNTLSAIAMGGAATGDLDVVRARCLEDVERVRERFRDRAEAPDASLLSLTQSNTGVQINRTGLSDEELLRIEPLLDRDTVQAVIGATRESIRNVAKHAGVSEAQLDISQLRDQLVLTISDLGRGFDGNVISGRGLAESVVARIRDVGGEAAIESTPGVGTSIRLRAPLTHLRVQEGRTRVEIPTAPESTLARIYWQGIQIWTLGVTAVGVVLELFNRSMQFSFTYVMLAIVVFGVWCGMLVIARPGRFSKWLLLLVVVAIPFAYVAGLRAVDFGADNIQYYQAIALSPLLLVLLLVASRWWFIVGVTIYSLSAASVVTVVAFSQDRAHAMEILIVSIPVLLVAAIAHWWKDFLTETVENLDANRNELLRLRAQLASREQMAQARLQWWAAGLRAALQTLNRIGDGRDDPRSSDIQQRCLAEEQFLRQLTMMSTRFSRLTPWIVSAMIEAQHRAVSLVLRVGDAGDASDPGSAEFLGGLIRQRVLDTSEGETVTVSVFSQGERSSMLLVGPPWKSSLSDLPADWSALHQDLGEHHLLEVTWPTG